MSYVFFTIFLAVSLWFPSIQAKAINLKAGDLVRIKSKNNSQYYGVYKIDTEWCALARVSNPNDPRTTLEVLKDGKHIGFRSSIAQNKTLHEGVEGFVSFKNKNFYGKEKWVIYQDDNAQYHLRNSCNKGFLCDEKTITHTQKTPGLGVEIERILPYPEHAQAIADMPKGAKQIAVGSAQHIWGINNEQKSYRWEKNAWVKHTNEIMHQVSVSADGTVWGINRSNRLVKRDGDSWQGVGTNKRFAQVAVGSATNVWGLDKRNNVHRWDGSRWHTTSGKFAQLAVGADGAVYGTTSHKELHTWNSKTNKWNLVSENLLSTHKQLVVQNRENRLLTHKTGHVQQNENRYVYTGVQSLSIGEDGTTWCIARDGKVYCMEKE